MYVLTVHKRADLLLQQGGRGDGYGPHTAEDYSHFMPILHYISSVMDDERFIILSKTVSNRISNNYIMFINNEHHSYQRIICGFFFSLQYGIFRFSHLSMQNDHTKIQ